MIKKEPVNQEPLTIEELKTMAGLPVWCPEEEAYGEDKKEIAMPPQNKEIDFGGQTLACPNCGQSAIVNPFRKDREIYPYCPWCGQKLKEAEDEQTK